MYNIKHKTSIKFEVNVVGVGNLEVGGTGKSPMIDFLIQYFLSKNYNLQKLKKSLAYSLGKMTILA